MQQFLTRIFVKPGWGAPVSILFHLALAVLVFYRLPAIPLPEPDPSVNVELVDPPVHEPDKPKPEEAPKSQPQAFESASQDVRKMEPTQSPPTPTEASDNEVDPKKTTMTTGAVRLQRQRTTQTRSTFHASSLF
jgi:outer membrane biosynthesis protein TonB